MKMLSYPESKLEWLLYIIAGISIVGALIMIIGYSLKLLGA